MLNNTIAPERLSNFLTCLIGKKVTVKQVLPNEGGRLIEEGSLLIMDILVELEDDTLSNIEIQKIAYQFPGERIDCYSSDLLLRQYSRVRSEKGKEFSYKDLKTVYTIVLYEQNHKSFLEHPTEYIHYGEITYNTGLTLNHLQKSIIIALDIFKKNTQTIVTELDAWLYFLCSDEPRRIWEIQEKFPYFKPLYDDIFQFRHQIKEVLSMYSKTLSILDRNTTLLMIDEMKQELEQSKREAMQSKQALMQKDQALEQKDQEIERLKAALANKNNTTE